MKTALIIVLFVGSGCAAFRVSASLAAQPFSLTTESTRIDVDGKGVLTARYEYPACIVPSKEMQSVTVTHETVSNKTQEISGLVSGVAAAIGYLLKGFLN